MTLYDDVLYPSRAFEDTHPDRLAAVAVLFGMQPASPERCRVLEVACSDGGNVIPMAYSLPESRFVGIDLALRPVESGRARIERLGLTNVTLRTQDLTEFSDAPGSFDFIIAHGLYSWVPAEVQKRFMALVSRHLAPAGVAFVSYNVYPGCHLRRMLWDVLKFHTEGLDDAQTRIGEATALATLLAAGREGSQPHALQQEAAKLLERDPVTVFHDDLAPHNDPLYFHEFIEQAAAQELQFLAECEVGTMGLGGLSPDARAVLSAMEVLTREQYLDFVRCRRFRQSLLCHAGVAVQRTPSAGRLQGLWVGCPGRVVVAPAGAETGGAQADPEHGRLSAMLDSLEAARPRLLAIDELHRRMQQHPTLQRLAPLDAEALAKLVLKAALTGAVTLHARQPRLALTAGERPLGSAVARLQAETDDVVTNLRHQGVRLDDPVARKLLTLLDGNRDRAQLLTGMGGDLAPEPSSRAQQLEEHLRTLARLALLHG
jgi:SAM-dependent methyltransferase